MRPAGRPSPSGLFYVSGNFDDPQTYETLKERLERVDQERGTGGNRIFYLATPPSYYRASSTT